MTITDGSTIAGSSDPLSGGFIESTTTGYGYAPPSGTARAAINTAAAASPAPKAAYVLIMLIVGLVALKFLSEHEKADLELAHVRISVWNWLAITLLAVTGIVFWKGVLNLWPGSKSGVTRVFNAA